MKRKLSLILAIVMVAAFILPAVTPVNAADPMTVYVSKEGSDTTGDGTEGNPYRSLNQAYKAIYAAGITDWANTMNTIYVVDDLGEGGITGTLLCGDGSTWTKRVSAKIVGLSDTASFTLCTTSIRAVTFYGNVVLENINVEFGAAGNDYEYYVRTYYGFEVKENVTTSGAVATLACYNHNAKDIKINGGTWNRVFLIDSAGGLVPASATIGGDATVTNLYTAGVLARSTQAINVTSPVNITISGGTVENLYAGGRTRQQTNAWTHTSTIGTVNVTVSGGTVNNLYMGGHLEGTGSGKISIANLNVTQTGGTINNVHTGVNYDGNTNENSVGTLNAAFTGIPAINMTVANMPTTAMNLNFGDVSVAFDADDLAAIKSSGATATTLAVEKTDAATDGYDYAYNVTLDGVTATADVTINMESYVEEAEGLNNATTQTMADQKIAFTDATLGLFEVKLIKANVATVGDKNYSTLQEALDAAAEGDVKLVYLNANVTVDTLILEGSVRLWLGDNTLTANAVIALDGTVSGSANAKLVVAQDKLKLEQADKGEVLVLWNSEGNYYTFATVSYVNTPEFTMDNGTIKFKFAPSMSTSAYTLLAAKGGADCGVQIQAKLIWDIGGNEMELLCTFTDENIKTYAADTSTYFYMTLPGYEALGIEADLSDLTIIPVVVSSTGMTIEGSAYTYSAQ